MDSSFAARLRSSPKSPATSRLRSLAGATPGDRDSSAQASFSGFERFFREQYPVVVRIAFGVTGDTQAAQDVAQDVFVAAFSRFPEPGEARHAGAWVRVAAAHTALNAIRGERRRQRRQQLSGIQVAPSGPEEKVLERESRAEVRRALARLPRRAATVLVLRHNGLSYAEVAQAMNVTVGQVGTMLRRAESALRKELTHVSRS
jgi:RNA polymerase sigma factor (sigma-70 family)